MRPAGIAPEFIDRRDIREFRAIRFAVEDPQGVFDGAALAILAKRRQNPGDVLRQSGQIFGPAIGISQTVDFEMRVV